MTFQRLAANPCAFASLSGNPAQTSRRSTRASPLTPQTGSSRWPASGCWNGRHCPAGFGPTALLGSALYLGDSLTPAMDAAQARGEMPPSDRLHHQYEQVSSPVQFPLLLLLALFGALWDTP